MLPTPLTACDNTVHYTSEVFLSHWCDVLQLQLHQHTAAKIVEDYYYVFTCYVCVSDRMLVWYTMMMTPKTVQYTGDSDRWYRKTRSHCAILKMTFVIWALAFTDEKSAKYMIYWLHHYEQGFFVVKCHFSLTVKPFRVWLWSHMDDLTLPCAENQFL